MAQLNSTRPAILHVLPQLSHEDGGDALYALLKGLQAEGWDMILACSSCAYERELRALGIQVEIMPLASRNPLTIWRNSRRLLRLASSARIKLVHAHDMAAGWSGALAAKRMDAAFITTIHRPPKAGLRGLQKRCASVMTAGDRIVVASDYMAECVQRVEPLDAARLRIIRTGIDLASFDPSTVRGHRMVRLSERWQLSLDHKIVLVPGAVREGAGQRELIDMMARNGRQDWQLLLIGELHKGSAYVKSLEQAIIKNGLAERVVFGGACDDMAAAFMMADLVALPANEDAGHAHLAIQAQAMGKPVLVSNAGALPEAVMPAATGWLVSAGDLEEMSWALNLALDMDGDVKARLALRAREFAAEEFSLTQMLRKTAALYRELVRDAPRPAKPKSADQTDDANALIS